MVLRMLTRVSIDIFTRMFTRRFRACYQADYHNTPGCATLDVTKKHIEKELQKVMGGYGSPEQRLRCSDMLRVCSKRQMILKCLKRVIEVMYVRAMRNGDST